jgi:uncharacterized RDD family membrane protein YckC
MMQVVMAELGPRVWVAGFWRRLAAALVDVSIVALVALPLCAIVAVALGRPVPRLGQLGPDVWLDALLGGDPLLRALMILIAVAFLIYLFVFHGLRGQTLGERLLKLRVIDGFGEKPSMLRALCRTLLYVPSLLLFGAGILWIAVDREKQGLHDWLADTYVIREGAPA